MIFGGEFGTPRASEVAAQAVRDIKRGHYKRHLIEASSADTSLRYPVRSSHNRLRPCNGRSGGCGRVLL